MNLTLRLGAVDVAARELGAVSRRRRSAQDPKDMEILRLRRENAKLRAALVDDGMRL